jgi:hypothetical protein
MSNSENSENSEKGNTLGPLRSLRQMHRARALALYNKRAASAAAEHEEARAAEEAAYEEALRAAHARLAAGGAGASASPVGKISFEHYTSEKFNIRTPNDVIRLIDFYEPLFESTLSGPLTYKLVKTTLQDAGVVLGEAPFIDVNQVKRAIQQEIDKNTEKSTQNIIEIGTQLADDFARFHAFCLDDYKKNIDSSIRSKEIQTQLNEFIASRHRNALSRKRFSCSSCTVSGGARTRRNRRRHRTRKIRRHR